MTTVMPTMDAPPLSGIGESSKIDATDPAAGTEFGALVDDARDALDALGSTTTNGEEDAGDEDDDTASFEAPADASALITLLATLARQVTNESTADDQGASIENGQSVEAAGSPTEGAIDSQATNAGEGVTADNDLGFDATTDALPGLTEPGQTMSTSASGPHGTSTRSGEGVEMLDVDRSTGRDETSEVASETTTVDDSVPAERSTFDGSTIDSSTIGAGHAGASHAAATSNTGTNTSDTAVDATSMSDAIAGDAAASGAVDDAAPWAQLARAFHRVERSQDGVHTMTVRLDPPELGTVDIEVRVDGGLFSVHAMTDSAATRDLLQRAMPELRASLEADGFSPGSLDVGARTDQNPTDQNPTASHNAGRHTSGRGDTASTATVGPSVSSSVGSDGSASSSTRLDLQL